MAVMALDPYVEKQVLAERIGTDGDQYDEVWDGVYIVLPLPNIDHQELVQEFGYVFGEVIRRPKLGRVFPGINLSDRDKGWNKTFASPT
jgi:hypothetical protein